MSISERLLQKLKTQFPKQCGNIEKLYRCYGVNDGVRFTWCADTVGKNQVFSYDTMTDCLKKNIVIDEAIFNGRFEGWMVSVK